MGIENIDVLEGFGKNFLDFGRGFCEMNLIAPTSCRKISDAQFDKTFTSYKVGAAIPALGTIFFALYPIAVYVPLFKYDSTLAGSILGTQITTNIISGLCEIFRRKKNKMQESSTQPKPSTFERYVILNGEIVEIDKK